MILGLSSKLRVLLVCHCYRAKGHAGDVNDDGIVDLADLVAVLSAWGPCT